MSDLMSTKEVARYLGINEKKVYYLAKAGKIPCTRVTGKWTFPKKLIDQWLEHSAGGLVDRAGKERSFLLGAGSDDPSLGILRELYAAQTEPTSLFMATVGSGAGLTALRDGVADFALAHLFDPASGEYNVPFVKKIPLAQTVIVTLFYRDLGILLKPGNPKSIESVADLSRQDVRMINRQTGSGTRHFLDHKLSQLGIDSRQLAGYSISVPTHIEVGLKVLQGEADAGLATRTAAQMLGLDFISLAREKFDILISKEHFFRRGIQVLMGIIGSREFRDRMEKMGGYDASESGRILTTN
jgi:putative molybdopterin biosynthesis protein